MVAGSNPAVGSAKAVANDRPLGSRGVLTVVKAARLRLRLIDRRRGRSPQSCETGCNCWCSPFRPVAGLMENVMEDKLKEIFGEYGCKYEEDVFLVAKEMESYGISEGLILEWVRKVYWAAASSFGA